VRSSCFLTARGCRLFPPGPSLTDCVLGVPLWYGEYYRRNHKRAPINVQNGQPGTSAHPIASTWDGLRDSGNTVSTTIVTLELLRRSPQLLQVGFVPLYHCVLHFLKRHHYTFCVVTHKAQNHRYHAMVIDGWVG